MVLWLYGSLTIQPSDHITIALKPDNPEVYFPLMGGGVFEVP